MSSFRTGLLAFPLLFGPLAASAQSGGWQVHEGTPARHSFGRVIANGDNEGFLSGAAIPAADAAGWSAAAGWPGATSSGALQWGGPGGTPCRAQANYTYFQTSIQPVPGAAYGIQFMNADDAARVSVMSGPSTINVPELVGLRDPKTIDLTPFLVPNAVNRVVITLADVCGAGNGIRAELKTTPGTPAPAAETMTIDGTVVRTGDIQVTLEWTGLADLDLAVTDPNGDRLFYNNKNVASGGRLDVDARGECLETTDTAATQNVENIFWETAPPSGTYRVVVDHYHHCDGGNGPVPYTVTLRRDGQVVGTPWSGRVAVEAEQPYSFTSNGTVVSTGSASE